MRKLQKISGKISKERVTFPRSARRAFPRKIPHSHLQLLHRASILSPSSKGAADFPTNEFSLKLITPDSKEPLVHDFHDAWGLDALVKSYHGSLRGPIPNRQRIISYSDYSTLSPGNTYEISSPYFKAIQEQRLHNQISDKAFESKARYALIKYFGAKGIEYREMERVIMSGLDAVGEWEGIFEVGDEVWFLECKNIVNEVNITRLDPL